MASKAAKAAAKAATTTNSNIGLSMGGHLLFGGLCVGTFGLGCWQVQRYFEKIVLIDERQSQLQQPPILMNGNSSRINDSSTSGNSSSSPNSNYRRTQWQGRFLHHKEVLIGPRGAPNGVTLPRHGLSAKSNSGGGGGMAPGPQGYHVLAPFQIKNDVIWVNRGWVPKTMVPGTHQKGRQTNASHRSSYPKSGGATTMVDPEMMKWHRPEGIVTVTAIQTSPERPRFITPEHDYSKRPLQLFWFDPLALLAIAEQHAEEAMLLVTQVVDDENENDTHGSKMAQDDASMYPLKPPVSAVGDFKTTPLIHAGYAATWYGLSAAGVYMTRKLMTRGR